MEKRAEVRDASPRTERAQQAERDSETERTDGTERTHGTGQTDGTGQVDGTGQADGTEQSDPVLRTFVRDGRLVRLPARWQRKLVVLRYVAERTFEPGVEYPERAVDEKLRAWCEGAPLDHVTLRRYLVDLGHLRRQFGFYWVPEGRSAA